MKQNHLIVSSIENVKKYVITTSYTENVLE